MIVSFFFFWWCCGSNPGPQACQATSLSLRYKASNSFVSFFLELILSNGNAEIEFVARNCQAYCLIVLIVTMMGTYYILPVLSWFWALAPPSWSSFENLGPGGAWHAGWDKWGAVMFTEHQSLQVNVHGRGTGRETLNGQGSHSCLLWASTLLYSSPLPGVISPGQEPFPKGHFWDWWGPYSGMVRKDIRPVADVGLILDNSGTLSFALLESLCVFLSVGFSWGAQRITKVRMVE